jgi:hypothetical protein
MFTGVNDTGDNFGVPSLDTGYYALTRIFIDSMTPAINSSPVSTTPLIIAGNLDTQAMKQFQRYQLDYTNLFIAGVVDTSDQPLLLIISAYFCKNLKWPLWLHGILRVKGKTDS